MTEWYDIEIEGLVGKTYNNEALRRHLLTRYNEDTIPYSAMLRTVNILCYTTYNIRRQGYIMANSTKLIES